MKLMHRPIYALVTLAAGLMLLVYGVVVEDEPTAIALLLTTVGAVWYYLARSNKSSQL